jgi:hypothetical protein
MFALTAPPRGLLKIVRDERQQCNDTPRRGPQALLEDAGRRVRRWVRRGRDVL